jgi:hypothetical protein
MEDRKADELAVALLGVLFVGFVVVDLHGAFEAEVVGLTE